MTDVEDIFRVEPWSDHPKGEEPACADCGSVRDLIGPLNIDGEVVEGGDMVCRECAETRGLDMTHCTCGVSSPREIACPGCHDFLGYEGSLHSERRRNNRSEDTGTDQGDDHAE